ncbi:hypothetical protein CDV36_009623 [Fusarium kuroshium]|uniref:ABC transporter domain-containing protein n=1 Tax=Fusarium kuroshium TaxID=2010991 RepID=A0A3M2RZJ6_9HYPO|nr:hypothetical protein CDV36_009623 [Fusarium kuroshium]
MSDKVSDDPDRGGILGHQSIHNPSSTTIAENTATVDYGDQHDANLEHGQHMGEEIHELARRITTRQSECHDGPLFTVDDGGVTDPSSPKFDARAWAKAFYQARVTAAKGTAPRTSGIAFKDLDVYGYGTATDYQKTVGNAIWSLSSLIRKAAGDRGDRIDILRNLEGVVRSGEMLCVLGPPGSGCSTALKTIAGDTHGFHIGENATVNYQGVRPEQMATAYRGEAIYTAEVDTHFAHLTVGDTLYFAARSRCPKHIPGGISRREYAEYLRDVIMAIFGISHTKNTRVGDDFVRGVSGGERKRVTIAEAALGYAPLQCWDNSTRGLDSANAIEFCRTLRTQADIMGHTACVAIYQAPQAAYDVFDKVLVLYEGRQIFFGLANEAQAYFEELGFKCPEQQTTADFLTSMTSPAERLIRPGFNGKVPVTADDFAQCWKDSAARARLSIEIEDYLREHSFDGQHHKDFLTSRRIDQSKMTRAKSPFTLSYIEQFRLTLWRSWTMLRSDPSITATMLISNLFEGLMVSSIFYNLPENTTSFFRRTLLLFFIVLINGFGSILEIMTLYTKRKIVEKHARYAFYHPSAEALSAMVTDLPYKIVNALLLNLTLYFMCNLRREAGPFFFFLLVSFTLTLAMSMMFRFIGSVTKTISQALAPSSILLLALVLYTGFTIPPAYMQDWLGWLRWVNPVFYGLESVFINEFVGRRFFCSDIVPSGSGYDSVHSSTNVCSVAGAVPGESTVDGEAYLRVAFGFLAKHKWRNFGVLIAFMILFLGLHLVATEYVASERSKGEVLVFTRAALKKMKPGSRDIEGGGSSQPGQARGSSKTTAKVEKQASILHWRNVCYDIKIKGEPRRILDHVDGWVKPGTLTALMGVSGAGKTTLLDVLASRVTMGVITGEMLVDGHQRDSSFQRKTGYVQQQDLHLSTSTVREALIFSALLRQPSRYSKEEKLAYVDEVIDLLDMTDYADAIVGIPGSGLNVEQRKRLTIGVELAARPQLLLFLDEPTSGLDSQTSWSICDLMEKLTRSGQAILCTIHQPSAMLFQRFDRLLLLAKGGKTVYFGKVGKNSSTLMDYFVRNGGLPLPEGANPAEHMLNVIGAAPGASTDIDWPAVWRSSPEYQGVQDELARLSGPDAKPPPTADAVDPSQYDEFAAPSTTQLFEVTKRIYHQFWRSPSYIYSKFILSAGTALFIGLSVLNSENSIRGLQNQMFGVFLFLTIFGQIIDQMMPAFVEQRTLYEARERPAKTYSWQTFLFGNIIIEMAWNSIVAVLSFIVCVLAGPKDLPGFWIFMYRVNPFTYVVEGFLGTTLANAPVTCANNEILSFRSPQGSTCAEYMADYINTAGGQLVNSSQDGSECSFCPVVDTNAFLTSISVNWANRWRDFGLLWVYIVFNLAATIVFYWSARVPKNRKIKKE